MTATATLLKARPAWAAQLVLFLVAAPLRAGAADVPAVLSVPAHEVIAAVSAQYAAVSNLSCTVRREIPDAHGDAVESVSRVDWARGDRMRVHALTGSGRRVVIDGKSIHVKPSKDAEAAVYEIRNQTPTQFANLRSVPGSPEEMLAPLAALEARDGVCGDRFARTVLFREAGAEGDTAALSFDGLGRVARLEFFGAAAPDGTPAASSSAEFKAPQEVLPEVWLFRRVESQTVLDGKPISAISRFDRFVVNDEIPDALFDPACDF